MIKQNLHTHTHYSDGNNPPIDYVHEALKLGMENLGFSDHSPLPFDNPFSLKSDHYQDYCAEVRQIGKQFADQLSIFLALEIDYIPGMSEDFRLLRQNGNLDYVIGSVHLVGAHKAEDLWFTDGPHSETYDEGLRQFYDNDIRKGVTAFYHQTNRMIESQEMDVVGHLDKIKMHNQNRFFREDEKWYINLVMETLQLIRENDLIAEVNTRGIYKKRCSSLFPSPWVLKEMHKMGIPVIISSDAHKPEELQMLFDETVEVLKQSGYRSGMRFTEKGWTAQVF